MNLQLERPLIFFDLETTGTNVMEDRIVEISVVKIMPDGTKEEKTRRVNPERHIPEAATAVHHITDEDVVGEPTFRQIANSMLKFFEGCDIAGFNSNRFDVPLLIEEFNRAGLAFPTAGRRFIDVQNIFHKLEQRTLVAAYRFYCGRELEARSAGETSCRGMSSRSRNSPMSTAPWICRPVSSEMPMVCPCSISASIKGNR